MIRFYVCWALSAVVLSVCLIWGFQKERRKSAKSVIFAGTFGVGGAVFVLRFSALYSAIIAENTGIRSFYAVLLTVGRSFVHTLQTFSLDEDYDLFLKTPYFPENVPVVVSNIYAVFFSILNVVAPVMTLAFIIALLEEVIAHAKTHLYPFAETYVFSELNECTVTMAEDIRGQSKTTFILFTDSYVSSDDELMSELMERAKRIGAVLIKDDITTMRLTHNPSVPITYVLADVNENDNLRVAAWLSKGNQKLNKYICANVLVFCSSKDSDTTVQATINKRSNKDMRFFIVNTYINQIYRLLIDHPLYDRMNRQAESGERRKCTVLVVGCGSVGEECIKAVSWCGQLPDTDLRVVAVSEDANLKEEYLRRNCPELFKNGIYDFEFRKIDVSSSVFTDYIYYEVPEACYVVIALGDDQRNISVASDLQRIYNKLCLKGGVAPQICYMVKDDNIFSAIEQTQDDIKTNECLMIPFGNNKKRFTLNSVLNSDFDKMALAVHLTYYRLPIGIPEDKILELKQRFLKGEHLPGRDYDKKKGISSRYGIALYKKCFPTSHSFVKIYTGILSFFRKHPMVPDSVCDVFVERENAIDAYYESLYGQHSSRASAIHLRYTLCAAGIYPVGKIPEESLQQYDEFINEASNSICVAKLEHLRWNAYMRSIGYTLPSDEDLDAYAYKNGNNHQNKKLLFHPCLVEWDDNIDVVLTQKDHDLYEAKDENFMKVRYADEIDDLDRVSLKVHLLRKQRTGKDGYLDYKIEDEVIIKNAADILRSANSNEETI